MEVIQMALACTVYVAAPAQEGEGRLEADLAAQKVVTRIATQTEITIHSWPTQAHLKSEAALAACLAKATETCKAAQKGSPGPCRYELHAGPAVGWEAARAVVWPAPKATKKRQRARKKKRRRARKKRKADPKVAP